MPTLIVEDGSGVASSNTYIDLAYLQSYVDDRGLTIPILQVDQEISILLAMDYLESRRGDFQGLKAVLGQLHQWPRTNVKIDCEALDVDAIPEELKKAQCQLVVEQQNNVRLYPRPRTSSVQGFVTQSTVGPLTKKFAADGASSVNPSKGVTIASVEIFLTPLTVKGACCGGAWKETLRV